MTIQDVAMLILLIFILFANVTWVMTEPPAQPDAQLEKAKRNSEDMSDDQ